MAGCNSSVVCNSENETMPQGARFKRCIGECCSNYLCNQGLYPVLAPVTPEPVSSYASVIATSSRNPTSSTNGKKPGPTSTAAALLGPYHWLIVSVSALFLPSMWNKIHSTKQLQQLPRYFLSCWHNNSTNFFVNPMAELCIIQSFTWMVGSLSN